MTKNRYQLWSHVLGESESLRTVPDFLEVDHHLVALIVDGGNKIKPPFGSKGGFKGLRMRSLDNDFLAIDDIQAFLRIVNTYALHVVDGRVLQLLSSDGLYTGSFTCLSVDRVNISRIKLW